MINSNIAPAALSQHSSYSSETKYRSFTTIFPMSRLQPAFLLSSSSVQLLRGSTFVSNTPVCRRRKQFVGAFKPVISTSHHSWRMSADEQKPSEDRNDGRATSGLFGIRLKTNGDVIKFGIAAIAIVYAIKSALQLAGTPDILAGQLTTGFVSVLSLVLWVSTYVFRVGTKGMTYAQQLRDYEDEVIKKRYEELSEDELAALSEELNDDV